VHPGVQQLDALGVRTVVLQRPSIRRIAAVLRSVRPDVAHVTDVWPQAVVAARIAGVPRVLVTHHTPELPRRDNVRGRLWNRAGWSLRPDVIYTSEADRTRDGRRPGHVVPLGIDLQRFGSAQPGLAKQGPLVGNVARLAEQKDHRTLLAAVPAVVARRPGTRFVIAGDGELREELERAAEGLPVDFLGHREDVPMLLASLDVFAFPSQFEGLCLAVIEAQAAGVPVVATSVGGLRETVVDGETGLLVPPRDPRALADAIVRLLDDPELSARLAEEARRRAQRYSEARMVAQTLELYGAGQRGRRAEAMSVSQPEG